MSAVAVFKGLGAAVELQSMALSSNLEDVLDILVEPKCWSSKIQGRVSKRTPKGVVLENLLNHSSLGLTLVSPFAMLLFVFHTFSQTRVSKLRTLPF